MESYPLATPDVLRERGYPMASSADLLQLQEDRNAVEDAQARADELQNLTLRRFMTDIGTAITGCMHDVLVVRHVSLQEAFCSAPRLRGFGFLLILLAVGGLLACLVLGLRT